jgi:hypothetical protein
MISLQAQHLRAIIRPRWGGFVQLKLNVTVPYRELGADYLDRQQPAALADRLLRRLRQLGVELQVLPTTRPPESADNALPWAT